MTPYSNISTGWPLQRLDEVCAINPRRDTSGMDDSLIISRVPMEAVEAGTGRLDASEHVPLGAVKKKSLTHFREGDVVLAKISPSFENGKVALATGLANGYAVGSTELVVLRPGKELLSKYLLHFLLSADVRSPLASTFSGTVGQQRISQDELRSVRIPVPPIDLQRAIVESLERMLSRLAQAESSASTPVQRLDALHRSLLERVYSGTLIPAHEGSWDLVPLGSLADTALGKMLSSETRTGEYTGMYLRNESVQWGRIDTSDLKSMSIPGDQVDRYSVRDGDLLVCEGGQPGRCAVWRSSEPMLYQKALHRVRPQNGVTADWLALAIEAAVKTNRHQSLLTGTTIAHLPQEKLRKLPVPIGQPSAMAAVLDAVQHTQTRSLRLKHSQAEVQSKSIALRRSILKAAFGGRLIAESGDARSFDEALEEIA